MTRDQFLYWVQTQEGRHEFDGFLERLSAGLTAFSRNDGTADWTAIALTVDDTLNMPELGISVPVHEFYGNVDFSGTPLAAEA